MKMFVPMRQKIKGAQRQFEEFIFYETSEFFNKARRIDVSVKGYNSCSIA
jgi:hypothetical protein